jgi:thiol:disulfide interchange protein
MKQLPLFVVIAVALGLYLGCKRGPAMPVGWAAGYDEALKEAGSKKSLAMVDFYTDWCGWCKKLDSDVYTDGAVSARLAKMAATKVDAEKGDGPELARRFRVSGFPTVLFLAPDGTEISRIEGYVPATEFLAEIDRAASKAGLPQ